MTANVNKLDMLHAQIPCPKCKHLNIGRRNEAPFIVSFLRVPRSPMQCCTALPDYEIRYKHRRTCVDEMQRSVRPFEIYSTYNLLPLTATHASLNNSLVIYIHGRCRVQRLRYTIHTKRGIQCSHYYPSAESNRVLNYCMHAFGQKKN